MSNGFVLKDAQVLVGPVGSEQDISAYCMSVTLNHNPDTPENTTMGNTNRTRLAGLTDLSLEIQFVQDFDSGAVDAVLWPHVGAAPFYVSVMANKTNGIGTTNPMYRGLAVISTYQPLQGNVGDVATTTVTFQAADSWSRYTVQNSDGSYA